MQALHTIQQNKIPENEATQDFQFSLNKTFTKNQVPQLLTEVYFCGN